MNLEKLKDTARRLEQKEDWRKAIEVYLKAIQQAESGAETTPDLSLYNRVGDLYLKINDTAEAVRSYERAVDLYADQGFFNNAIALCGKILRVNPGRTQTYLKLSQLHARKNVVIEAKRNLIEFLERMNALGQLDQAFQSVKLFADQFSGSQEIRAMLIELLRATSREDEAQEQLEKMAQDLEAMGDKTGARKTRERIHTDDAEHTPPPPADMTAPPSAPRRGDLIFLDTGVDVARPVEEPPLPVTELELAPSAIGDTPAPEGLILDEDFGSTAASIGELIVDPMVLEEETTGSSDSLLGIERIGESMFEAGADLDAPLDIERQEPPDLGFEGMPLEGMEGTSLEAFSTDPQAAGLDFADDIIVSLPDAETLLEAAPEPEEALGQDLMIDSSPVADAFPMAPEEEPPADQLADLEDRVLDDPENPDIHLEMAEGLLAVGETGRMTEELELALAGYEDREDWLRAAEVADRLVELVPDSIGHHQKRVELAFRTGDREPLLEAYMGLGDALSKSGALDKAIAVYGRVIEHDPGNIRAAAAITRLGGTVDQAEEPVAPPAVGPISPPAAPPAAPPPQPAPSPPPAPSRPAALGDDFVDLGSMVMENEGRRDTRMRVDRLEPKDQDEQREFHEILEQFKRGIDQNLDSEDYQARYDLGVAFKEMGLLDEAIAEFQKALRAPEGRLRTSEALGIAFFEKGQYAVCESVLRRAVEGIDGPDEAKIGLIYWLGRASEALGKEADAIASYERALAIDIRFMDLSQRVQRLTAGRRQ